MNSTLIYLFLMLIIAGILYYIMPKKFRWSVLLIASMFFYVVMSKQLIAYVLFTVLITYLATVIMQRNFDKSTEQNKKKLKKINKAIEIFTILLNLGLIGVLKYFNFFGGIINDIASLFSSKRLVPTIKFLMPIGISFYTLQAISYIVDVNRKKYPASKNFFKVALYLMFFPQVVEGPIARFDQTADQLYQGHSADYKGITFGLQRIMWGLFKKIVVADRLFLLVNTVGSASHNYSGIASLLFILFYTFQLYADFSGFIDIAMGISEVFGIKLPENFKQPFFAKSSQEFWQRWHISLGAWLKEYVFYSVAFSPKIVKATGKLKKKWRNHFTKVLPTIIALFAVWLCNGLWHGPEWKYIVYGMYYFVIISVGMLAEPLTKKCCNKMHINIQSKSWQVFRHIRTLLIIFVGETIFGANSLADAFYILASVFKPYHGNLLSMGLDYKELIMAAIGLATMLIVSIVKEKNVSIREKIASKPLALRWTIYLALILFVVMFGAYGGFYKNIPSIYQNF